MEGPNVPPQPERIRRLLDDLLDRIARGQRPDLKGYFLRYPEIELELRGHFRRLGLLEDPFRDAEQYLREVPPWESGAQEESPTAAPRSGPAPGSPAGSSPPAGAPRAPRAAPAASTAPLAAREVLLEGLGRRTSTRGLPGRTWRRLRAAALFALAFVGGWGGLVLLEELTGRGIAGRSPSSRAEGVAALLALASERPRARADLLAEALSESDHAIREHGARCDLIWLRFLAHQALGKAAAAARDLEMLPEPVRRRLSSPAAGPVEEQPGGRGETVLPRHLRPEGTIEALGALGEVLMGKAERAAARLGPEPAGKIGALVAIARGAAFPAERPARARRLLESPGAPVRLLGAAWARAAGDAGARAALEALPLEGLAAARVLVDLGEEELFLRRAPPGRLDLAPLRLEVLARRGERTGARRLAEELLAAAPDSFDLRLLAARFAREAGDRQRSLDHVRAAALIRRDSPEPMREWLLLAAEAPDDHEALQACADLFLRRAAAEVRAVLARGEARPGAGAGPERLLAASGFGLPADPEARARAVSAIERAAAARPASGAVAFLLGRALFALGLWSEAAEHFDAAARRVDPLDQTAARAWLAASLRRSGRTAEAQAEELALDSGGGDPAGRLEEALEAALAAVEGAEARAAPRLLARTLAAHPDLEAAAVRLAHLSLNETPESREAAGAARAIAARVDLATSGPSLLDEYARALEWSGGWIEAGEALGWLLEREPGFPGARARAAWAWAIAGDRARAEGALLAAGAGAAAGGSGPEEARGEEAIVLALLAAGEGAAEAAEGWLGAAIRQEPTDPRPWFLRGYLRQLSGADHLARRDLDEALGLAEGAADPGSSGRGEGGGGDTALERSALPWLLALIHAFRGEEGAAAWYAPLGPAAGRTLPGSFFRAAAHAAAGEWEEAEAEARRYRARGFPLQPWQAQDPWAGSLFSDSPLR